jgi:hypothetical protein
LTHPEPRGLGGIVPRNIIGTSGFSIGRYHAGPEKAVVVEQWMACKRKQRKRFIIIFELCERHSASFPYRPTSGFRHPRRHRRLAIGEGCGLALAQAEAPIRGDHRR